MATDGSLWEQVVIYENRLQPLGTENVICGNRLFSLGTHSNMWEQIVISGQIVIFRKRL